LGLEARDKARSANRQPWQWLWLPFLTQPIHGLLRFLPDVPPLFPSSVHVMWVSDIRSGMESAALRECWRVGCWGCLFTILSNIPLASPNHLGICYRSFTRPFPLYFCGTCSALISRLIIRSNKRRAARRESRYMVTNQRWVGCLE